MLPPVLRPKGGHDLSTVIESGELGFEPTSAWSQSRDLPVHLPGCLGAPPLIQRYTDVYLTNISEPPLYAGQWVATREYFIFLFSKRPNNGTCMMLSIEQRSVVPSGLMASWALKRKAQSISPSLMLWCISFQLFSVRFSSVVKIMHLF